MSEHRIKVAWITAPLFLVLVSLCLGGYVGGYFYRCEREVNTSIGFYRFYESDWQADIFQPAARVHSLFRDKPTHTGITPIVG